MKRSNGTLSIRLASKTISIVDKSSEGSDDIEEYCYLGFNKQINSHLLHVQHYEGNAYLVIHHESGQRAFTSGYPVAAPDGNHFMSLSEDLFAGYVPNGIEIWQVSAGTYVRVANFETKWGPHDGNWLDARRARVAKQCFSPTENDPVALKMCGVVRIQRTGQTWKLVE